MFSFCGIELVNKPTINIIFMTRKFKKSDFNKILGLPHDTNFIKIRVISCFFNRYYMN